MVTAHGDHNGTCRDEVGRPHPPLADERRAEECEQDCRTAATTNVISATRLGSTSLLITERSHVDSVHRLANLLLDQLRGQSATTTYDQPGDHHHTHPACRHRTRHQPRNNHLPVAKRRVGEGIEFVTRTRVGLCGVDDDGEAGVGDEVGELSVVWIAGGFHA